MIVYVVAKANTYDDYGVDILGVYKNEKDAEKCFTDYILEDLVNDDMSWDDLTDEEKEDINNWNYEADCFKIIISKEEVK